ncbi:MAG: hypothetical protein GF331_01090 [Chitinivibrionales bacterium]|nr:hypothetical protein [Chitinivibrionales bacterium]
MTHVSWVWVVMATTAAGLAAQQYSISGVVSAPAGNAIENATVMLESAGLKTSTYAEGRFVLESATGTARIGALRARPAVTVRSNALHLHVDDRTRLRVASFTTQGRLIGRVERTLDPGSHGIVLPERAAGVAIHRIRIGRKRYTYTGALNTGTVTNGGTVGESTPLSRKLATHRIIDDVLRVSKKGMLDYRMEIKTADTSGLSIVMLPSAGTMQDGDGNVYNCVRIGPQVWTVENLRTTSYMDGTPIAHKPSTGWSRATEGAYCFYDTTRDTAEQQALGALYNFHALTLGKFVPDGWRVPWGSDWSALESWLALNAYTFDGSTATEKTGKAMASRTDWQTSATTGNIGHAIATNNRSGLCVLPAGYRDSDGQFRERGREARLWVPAGESFDSAQCQSLHFDSSAILEDIDARNCGFAVRCVKLGSGLAINEVDYDQPGSDTAEFVELFNSGADALDLSSFALIVCNGSTNSEAARFMLSGTLEPGEFFVLANSGVSIPQGVQHMTIPENSLQNGSPDALALFNVDEQWMWDAVCYEGKMESVTIDGVDRKFNMVEGTVTSAEDDNYTDGSIIRYPDGKDTDVAADDWCETTTATPGAPNVW